ncbi:MFS transporter [Coleofasciculus sp. H7-2]|uniref:MFS transporter n=1 Tax=Coleofasciculus sp. H7-2 TaxID=3351545 RepID=UPI00366B51C5
MMQRYDSDLQARSLSLSQSRQRIEDGERWTEEGKFPRSSGLNVPASERPHPAFTGSSTPTTSRPLSDERLTPPQTSEWEKVRPAISFPHSPVDDAVTPKIDTETDDPSGEGLSHSASPSSLVVDEAATEEAQGFLPVLKNRNFLALWGGQVFSQIADKVYLVLVIALIATHFQAPDQTISVWVSAIMMAFTIPAVLFGSVAGVFVDRWPKKAVLVATNLLRGALVLAVPPLLWISHGWSTLGGLPVGFCILLGLTFLISTLTQFFAPAEQSVIPLVVGRHHLLSANSLYTMTMMASVIVGFAVGEPLLGIADTLVGRLGVGADIGKELVVGSSYAIAGLLLLFLRTGEKTNDPEQDSPHVWEDLRDGLRYLKEQRRVRNALIQLVILFSVFAALSVLAVRMAEVIPGLKSSQFGFLLAAGGVGMAGGATVLGHFGQRFSHNRLSLYGSMGTAASLVGLGLFTKHLLLAFLLTTLLGFFGSMVAIPMQTTIQAETPDQMRGKVFGLQNNVINIALSLPLALAGVAETILGLQAVFLGLAAIAIAGGLLTWYISGTGKEK